MIHWREVVYVIGTLLLILSVFMVTALPFAIYYGDGDVGPIGLSIGITAMIGVLAFLLTRNHNGEIGKREGFLIVAGGWVSMSLCCSLPYVFGGVMPDFTNALYESVSGLTTTGASVVNDIEALPRGILYWRSLTQWIGGMGIIVLTVALFPLLGIGGVELFVNEAPGPTSDKLHPRIKDTARALWFIYLGLTVVLMPILYFCGMSGYDAINHALTTMATGGFSTKNASIAAFESPLIEWVLTGFMFVAGINYTVIYFGLTGKFRRAWGSEEFRAYLYVILALIVGVAGSLYWLDIAPFFDALRTAAFQIVSIVTTTGFASADYSSWSTFLTMIFFVLLFVGACAGSTSGGIKIIRHLVFFKNCLLEFKRLLHPRAIVRMKIDEQVVPPRILTHVLVFLLLYLLIFVAGSILMAFILRDFDQPLLSALGAVATSLGNVGPSIGDLGPTDNFYAVPGVGKWLLIFIMLLGRLELFTILILLSPYFWRDN